MSHRFEMISDRSLKLREQFVSYTLVTQPTAASTIQQESDFFDYITKQFVKWHYNQQQLFLDQLLYRCSDGELQALASALELVFHREFGTKLFGYYPALFLKNESKHPRHDTRKSTKQKNSEEERIARLFDNDIHFPALAQLDISSEKLLVVKDSLHSLQKTKIREVKSHASFNKKVNVTQNSLINKNNARVNNGDITHINKANQQNLDIAAIPSDNFKLEETSVEQEGVSDVANNRSVDDNDFNVTNNDSKKNLSVIFVQGNVQDAASEVNDSSNTLNGEQTGDEQLTPVLSDDSSFLKQNQSKEENDLMKSFAEQFVRSVIENTVKQLADSEQQFNRSSKSRDVHKPSVVSRTRVLPSFSQHASLPNIGKSENLLHTPRNTATLHHNPWKSHAAYPWRGRDFRAPQSRATSSHTIISPQVVHFDTNGHNPQSAQINNQALETILNRLDSLSNRRECAILCRLLKLCDSSTIDFLANRLYQRFISLVNIDWLPDDMLIRIFANLEERDIASCAQVCHRWRQLCYADELWMTKCHILARKFRLQNVERLLMEHLKEEVVDWRLAYKELPSIVVHHVTERERTKLNKRRKEQVKASALARMSYRLKAGLSADLDPGNGIDSGLSPAVRIAETRMTSSPVSVSSSVDDVTLPSPVRRWDSDLTSVSPKKPGTKTTTVFRATASYKVSLHLADGTPLSVPSSASQELRQQKTEVVAPATETVTDTQLKDAMKEITQQTIVRNAEVANDVRVNLKQPFDLLGRYSSNQRPMWSRLSENRVARRKATTQRRKFAGYVPDLQRVLTLKGHTGGVQSVQTDKKRVFSGGRDHVIVLWDVRSGNKVRELLAHKGSVSCLLLDGNTLYSGSWDMSVLVWDTISLTVIRQLSGHQGSVTCLHTNDQYLLTASHDGTTRVWNKITYKLHGLLGPVGCHVLGVHGDAEQAVTLSADRCIRLYSLATCECHQMISTGLQSAAILAACGQLLAVADHRGIVKFWSSVSGAAQAAIQAHDESISALTIHKGRFYTASSDKTIREWDLSTLTCIRHLQGHADAITDIQVADTRIVSCSVDGEVRVWDFVSHAPPPQQQQQAVTVGNSLPYLLPHLVDLRDEQPRMEGEEEGDDDNVAANTRHK